MQPVARSSVRRLRFTGIWDQGCSKVYMSVPWFMSLRGLTVKQQIPITIKYKDLEITGQRLDLVVLPGVVVEIKSVESLLPVHGAQLLSYLKATGYRLGLLVNFNMKMLKNGIKRIVN